jgi:hypothetical protein
MIAYRILPQQKLIVLSLWGKTTAEEIIRLSVELQSDAAFSTDYDALVDNTYLEHPCSSEELRLLAEPRGQTVRPGTRLAVVAPTDVTYGTSRMHQLLTEYRSPLHIEVFRDRSSALKWLDRENAAVECSLEEMAGGAAKGGRGIAGRSDE